VGQTETKLLHLPGSNHLLIVLGTLIGTTLETVPFVGSKTTPEAAFRGLDHSLAWNQRLVRASSDWLTAGVSAADITTSLTRCPLLASLDLADRHLPRVPPTSQMTRAALLLGIATVDYATIASTRAITNGMQDTLGVWYTVTKLQRTLNHSAAVETFDIDTESGPSKDPVRIEIEDVS